MGDVVMNVYDVTNSANVRANSAIVNLNKIMRDGIGIGGIFHGAVQVYDQEWSFGFCDFGTGVFSCAPKSNPMYTYRETVPLGRTMLAKYRVNQILRELGSEWAGTSYDLLSRNCNHFCEELCFRLGVQKLPSWVNRFANAGDAAVEVAGNTMDWLRHAKADIMAASRTAVRFMFGGTTTTMSPDSGLQETLSLSSSSSRRLVAPRSPSRLLLPRNQVLSNSNNATVERPVKQSGHSGSCFVRCICASCCIGSP